jgi:hypothetical protein
MEDDTTDPLETKKAAISCPKPKFTSLYSPGQLGAETINKKVRLNH